MRHTHTKALNLSARHLLGAAAALTIVTATVSGQRPTFYSDDPIARVVDTQNAQKVQNKYVNLAYDQSRNLFGNPGDQDMNRRAMSINTIDEVPDSNWFTNRIIGTRPMTVEEIAKGPDTGTGPAPASGRSRPERATASRLVSRSSTRRATGGSSNSIRPSTASWLPAPKLP